MKRVFTTIMMSFLVLNSVLAHADGISSLTLTDAEMQKLRKFFPTDESSHLVWNGDPIKIALPLEKEKRIVFPTPVSIDVKSALTSNQLRIVNNDKSLYLTALKSFQATRIYVTLKESGEVVLIDLMTDDKASSTTQQIEIKQNNIVHKTDDTNHSSVTTTSDSSASLIDAKAPDENRDMSYVDLIRFAWQEMYAPERLLPSTSHYTRVPMHTDNFVSDLIYGDKVIAHPISSWVSGDNTVTAIALRSKYPHTTHIDLHKDLCGNWLAGTLYPRSMLKPVGDKQNDSTMLFLVSSRSFAETIGVCHGHA